MRVLFVGGTGPVGQAAVPYVLDDGHEVAVAHSGAHEPPALGGVEHLHGDRRTLLAAGGPAEQWRPDVLVDTFAGGATAAKANVLGQLAERCNASQIVAVSSLDVYRHCAAAGVDGNEPVDLPFDALPLGEGAARRSGPSPGGGVGHDNVAMEDALHGASRITVLRPGAIYGSQLHPRVLREWHLVGKVARGERGLELPAGGTQLFHRVALDRVGRAVAAAIRAAPHGRWECNVADPRDLTYGGLARLVAAELGWEWDTRTVAWDEGDHP
jgi:nucleoside-diphosphate-sugar epimerase